MDSGAPRLNLQTRGPPSHCTKYAQGEETSYLDEIIVVDREVQEHCPPVHRNRSLVLFSLAIHHHENHEQLEATGDLEKAIFFNRKALSISLQADLNNYPASLNNLANSLFTRHVYLGVLQDLHEVIALDREALEFRPRGHPDRSSSLNNLAIDLSTQYKQLGSRQDLHEAISLGREAADLRPKGHHDRPSALSNLAVYLWQLGALQDLDEAIILGREALDLRPTEQSQRFSSVNNLAVFLYTRYKELQTLHDLDEAIFLAQEALDLCPVGHLDRTSSLNNLGLYLTTRYCQLGPLQDLDEAIVLAREALDLCPNGRLDRLTSLNNVSVHLSTRYTQLGVLQDINEVVILRREALDLCPKGHSKRLCLLDSLARSLSTRYKQLGAPNDIEEAIALCKEALNSRAQRHTDRSFSLNILTSCLSARYNQVRALRDLEEAIVLGREALDLCPNERPRHLCSLDSLARSLSIRYKDLGALQDLEEVIVLVREALDLRPKGHPRRLCSLHVLARNLSTRYKQIGASHDLEEAIVLEREALDLCLEGRPSLAPLAEHPSARYDQFGPLQDFEEIIVLAREALHLPSPQDILLERSKAFIAAGSWEAALDDANQIIAIDPSSPRGYEIKHAALHLAGDYDNAINAFETMLLKIADSPDPEIQRKGDEYISPSSTKATIRKIVNRIVRRLPRVLINTETGCLCDRAEHASEFDVSHTFKELVSSTTTRIDHARIKRAVVNVSVYDLDESPTHDKLQMFCKVAHSSGFRWAWSDTCCINKADHFVLQEALVAMFKWYEGAVMTIVFLRGVQPTDGPGALSKHVWNTRGWTLQEYIASKVVRFYTEGWSPYLDLNLPNHKQAPEVISEMEEATGVSAEDLMTLRPGLSSIREKLNLASTRQTTFVEDSAYSLLGIFSVAGLSAVYGEGDRALGRLLAHVLAVSGDVSVLAWTGQSGSHNSCLPAHTAVFNEPATSYIPSPIPTTEMERRITALESSSFDLNVALSLYDRLNDLPPPWFAASRMKLPCLAFRLPPLSQYRAARSGRVYRTNTQFFGVVEIGTRSDLSRIESLYLVHPWLDSLLERQGTHGGASAEDLAPVSSPIFDDEGMDDTEDDDEVSLAESEWPPHTAAGGTVQEPMSRETRARRLAVRLRQPFGALLLAVVQTGTGAYVRVATDSLVVVQFRESVRLTDILDNVRTLDVV